MKAPPKRFAHGNYMGMDFELNYVDVQDGTRA